MIKKNQTSVYNMNYHLVLVTKYRKVIFDTEDLQNDMKKLLIDYSKKHNIELESIEVMPDHVHMLISFPPKLSASEVVKILKGASARSWFNLHPETKSKLWKGHLWHRSYYIGTLGDMSKKVVTEYIKNQQKEPPVS